MNSQNKEKNNSDEKSLKQKIIDFLEKRGAEPTTIDIIKEGTNISRTTIHKYLLVLKAEGKLIVRDFGNIKFYYINKNE